MKPRPTKLAILSGVSSLLLALGAGVAPVDGFDREPAAFQGEELWGGYSADCMMAAYNTCSGWTWVYDDVPGAVWGIVLDPNRCPGGCGNGGYAWEVYFYTRCSSVPGRIGGIGIHSVDAAACLTSLLYQSGPITVTRCVTGDHWLCLEVPRIPLMGDPCAFTFEWGPTDPATGQANPRIASDNGLANFFCRSGVAGFPGCEAPAYTCGGWWMPPQRTYIYLTDLDGDAEVEDLCALYGAPYGLAFPNVYYSYLTNNLLTVVGISCCTPEAVEPTSWGHVKALFD